MKHLFFARWSTGAWAAAVACLLGLACLVVPFLQDPVNLSYELPFLLRPDIPIQDVVMVYMDEESEARLHQGRWERWDRSLHARLLTTFTEAKAKAVVFDVLFLDTTNALANQALADAAKRHGQVAVAAIIAPLQHEGETIGKSVMRPYEALAAAAKWGVVEASDADKSVREHYREPGHKLPSLAWRAAELTMASPPDPFASRWVNYYGPAGFFSHYSYADVLATNFNARAAFSNKVVFVGGWWSVGFTGGLGTDNFRTPHWWWSRQKLPGVDINATTYLNLLRGDWLSRLPPPLETGLVLGFGLLAGFGLAPWRPLRAAVLALVVALVLSAGCYVLMWQTRVWFPWLLLAGVQLPAALLCCAFAHTRQLLQENRALEQALVITQAGASPAEVMQRATLLTPEGDVSQPAASAGPVGMGSSARRSGPSPAIADILQAAPPPPVRPTVSNYVLIKSIGKGAYGEVWLARDIIGSYQAVKLVYRDNFRENEPFEREFNGIRHFTPISRRHPGLVHILYIGRNEKPDYLYYIMELGDDENDTVPLNPDTYRPKNLAGELERRGRLPLRECLGWACQLCDALDYLHQQGLIHRDIKPSNVIFVHGAPKFADIGLVTEIATGGREVTYLGTKGYIAPEGPGTPSADVYSLGKVIYQAGFGVDVGRYPELPTEMVENAEETSLFELNRIVLKACDSNPSRRYQTARELGQALSDLKTRLGSAS